jgi:hypothetical protein
MDSTASLAIDEVFALPARHADLQAQAAEVASKFAGRHREVRQHAVETSIILWMPDTGETL